MSWSENSSGLSDLEDHFRRGMPRFKIEVGVACAGLPTTWWYPNYHNDNYSETRSEQQEREQHNRIAVALCNSCLFKLPCMEWAIERDEVGIWGGTFDGTRVKIRKARGLPKPAMKEHLT